MQILISRMRPQNEGVCIRHRHSIGEAMQLQGVHQQVVQTHVAGTREA